jgi:hypothetical protein
MFDRGTEDSEEGKFEPEYAEMFGVPFSFLPCRGATGDPRPGPPVTPVRAEYQETVRTQRESA